MAAFMNIRAPKSYRVRTTTHVGDYHGLYRFTEENVEWLTEYFLGDTVETRGGALSKKKRMETYLRFIGDPGFQSGIAKDIGVHRTTVCKTLKTVSENILEKANLWIKFPQTDREKNDAKVKWNERYDFPCAIGALDCTHIRIPKPTNHGDEYVNRKGTCSLNVQMTCNSKEEITSVDVQWPGSVHDNRILRRSAVYRVMNQGQSNALLLGDSGYGILPWLLTPYGNPRTPQETAYNNLLKKERVIIERCFGQLKRRFPVLNYIRVKLHKVPSVIINCVVLHNIAKYLNDPLEEDAVEGDDEDEEEEVENDIEEDEARLRRRGILRREEVKSIIDERNNM